MLIDSHCHLEYYSPADIKNILDECRESDIAMLNNICVNVKEFEKIVEPCYLYPNIYCSIGTHPCHTEEVTTVADITEGYSKHESKIIGVGETGLDYYYEGYDKDRQIASFRNHIEFSATNDLPLIVHSRDAEDDTYSILKDAVNSKGTKGVIHCFTGSKEFMEKMLELGFYISLSGIVTFKNALDLQETIKHLPIERMLLETDSPYLSPLRGKQNRPAYVKHTAAFLARYLELDYLDLSNITTDNFFNLFTKADKKAQ